MKTPSIFSNAFDPKSFEDDCLNLWASHEVFKVDPHSSKEPYVILMPPPNVTAQLHMGHGSCFSFQDLLIRWQRMMGKESLWQGGTDHAGIATQMMVEKDLSSQGIDRKQIGRDAFVEHCHNWKKKYGDLIFKQFAKIGFSPDWSRTCYTLDESLSHAVRHCFVQLFKDGYIYRGERLVNWDPELETAISDDEVIAEERSSHIWTFQYQVDDLDPIAIATTRPETMFGDTAVCVHPDDPRYKDYIGREATVPLCHRKVPIIADEYVKMDFGTGALKITPAHDVNDFSIGKKHRLPFITIFDSKARTNESVPKDFRNLDRFECRKAVIKAAKEQGFFVEEKSHKYAVPLSDRSKSVIEPRLSMQWYVRMADIARPAADAARNNEIRFYPESWKKTYLHWLDNIEDWCISRQLWWGHRIPIWHCQDCHKPTCELQDPSVCSQCGSSSIHQDEDVLDTWFSSWLWPLSTMGWPDEDVMKKRGFDRFYPSHVLVTGADIIFLWVARMIMAGLYFRKTLPFKDLYFSAIVTDKKGRKFSKTLGNGIDPLEVIDQYGADAVRYTAVSLAPLGGRIMMDQGDFEQGSRFANKIWNAARFLTSHLDTDTKLLSLHDFTHPIQSQWLLQELDSSSKEICRLLENYRLNDAVQHAHRFMWSIFCDWGLEIAKEDLQNLDSRSSCQSVLVYVFDQALRLLHPVMPFITEHIWQNLPQHPDLDRPKSLGLAKFPQGVNFDTQKGHAFQSIVDLIICIRSSRQQVGLPGHTVMNANILCDDSIWERFEQGARWITKLAHIKEIQRVAQRQGASIVGVHRDFEVFLPADGLIDLSKERDRLRSEEQRLSKILQQIEGKLNNVGFIKNADPSVVEQTRSQRDNIGQQLLSLRKNQESLSG